MARRSYFDSLLDLSEMAARDPLRVVLLAANVDSDSLTLTGLVHPWRVAEQRLGRARCSLDVFSIAAPFPSDSLLPTVALLVADDASVPPSLSDVIRTMTYCRHAPLWGAVGAAVSWLLESGDLQGVRVALPWHLRSDWQATHGAMLVPELYSVDQGRVTCCGGAASIDLALALIGRIYGADLQAEIMRVLCMDRVRGGDERQPLALSSHTGKLQPVLVEAVALMESNIEEPLHAEEIAHLVGLSCRQLERQFKQHLGKLPARFYLELRLQRARQLLRNSHHSIVQVGLMCGFVSPSHFASAYGNLFGITPREERQRKLQQD